MNEKPIIFNGDMINAILKGCKTQTRRVVRPQPKFDIAGGKPELRGKYSFLRLPGGSETGYINPAVVEARERVELKQHCFSGLIL